MEKPAKTQMAPPVKRPAQAPTTTAGEPVVARPAAQTTQGAIKTPLPGVILQVKCNVGDMVKRGQTLIVLEAMGADNWQSIGKWKESQTLIANYPIYIYPRRGYAVDIPKKYPNVYLANAPLIEISSSFIRKACR